NGPRLGVADLWVAFSSRGIRTRSSVAEVVVLRVEVVFGEPEEVGEIVHAIMHTKQIHDGRINVVAAWHPKDCWRSHRGLPYICERENVRAVVRHGAIGLARRERTSPR